MKKKILVFGGTGFLGSSLVKFFLKTQEVVVIYRDKLNFLECVCNNKNLVLIKSELCDGLAEKLKEFEIEIVYHLASQQPSGSIEYEKFYDGNVVVTQQILKIIKALNLNKVVFVSTSSVYGQISQNNKGYINEKSHIDPVNNYGLTKYISEKILEYAFHETNCKLFIVRFPSLFGKNHLGGLAYDFTKLAKESRDITLFNNGETYRNLMYVDKAVEFLSLVYSNCSKLNNKEVFLVGSTNSLMIKDIVKHIITLTNSRSNLIFLNKTLTNNININIDQKYAINKLKFKPEEIFDGLMKYVEKISR
ncbi:MAG: NAD-dependent epimerase/dehydratase family protein [Bacteroidia bacterium]|jgi:nucleoside-diphosphate-sugar epimerase